MFLTDKNDGRVKVITCGNGIIQRLCTYQEDDKSPTASKESVSLTGVVDETYEIDVATIEIINAFLQAEVNNIPV